MIAFIKSGENYQFAAGGHPLATAGNHPVVGQFGISPFHQQQTQVQFQTHRIGIDPQGNLKGTIVSSVSSSHLWFLG